MHLFYTPDISGDLYKLNEEESRHCIKVLRLKQGDVINLTDGKGNLYFGKIVNTDYKKCEVEVIDNKSDYGKRNFFLHIAVAPTKNIDRTEWFLEKSTEIGIDEITPLACSHSERVIIKPERMNKVILSAVKQSLKAYFPKLNNLTTFKDFVKIPFEGAKYIAHCYEMPKEEFKNILTKGQNVLILIGPEGDFSEDEVKIANSFGFNSISLGNSRLRTETAAIVACHTVNLINYI